MLKTVLGVLFALVIYLVTWPVPIEPVAWQAPVNEGYVGDFSPNNVLAGVEQFDLGGVSGPEDITVDKNGTVYASTAEGYIVRLSPDGQTVERWVNTEGSPLGLEFDPAGNLLVADAYKGLLSINPAGEITLLTNSFEGQALKFVDDLDIADNGMIYFSDATTKFGAEEFGGTMPGSKFDTLEHGGHGRLLSYDPKTKATALVVDGLNFANGVAMSFDQQSVLVNETTNYRILKVGLIGQNKGKVEVVMDNLPGFPDNINRGLDGRYWAGLIFPRDKTLDDLSDKPFLRKVIMRLPDFMHPQPRHYAHVVAFNDAGEILENLQAPDFSYSHTTGAAETTDYLYISSLNSPTLARLPRK